MEEETSYTIKTTNRNDAMLMLSAVDLALALDEVMSYYRNLYNGKEYDTSFIYDGELISSQEYFKKQSENNSGKHKDAIEVLTIDQVLRSLDRCLDDVRDIVARYLK